MENGNLEAYLRDMVAGRHCSQNRSESGEGCLNNSLSRGFARVKALAMATLTVVARSKKKEKVDGSNESQMILLGYYMKFGPRNQESCINLGINGCDTVGR